VVDQVVVAPAGTVTFLFTDIEGSTVLWEGNERVMQGALARHDALLRIAIEAHSGFVFATTGDGVAAAFARAGDAVAAAIEAQRELQGTEWPAGAELRVRMGLHTGEAHERGGDYFGPPVNRAARVMAAANGGQIAVSSVTRELVQTEGVQFVDLGAHALRGVPEQIHLFGIATPELAWLDTPLRTAQATAAHLPHPVTEVIGRASEVPRLVSELTRRRLVTLIGPGGVGKTRLAVEVAWLSLDSFTDGAWMVELAPVDDEASVVSAIATTLGVRAQEAMTLEESLFDTLGTSRALLLLDNCEHVLDASRHLAARLQLACPNVTVLATSREPLGVPGEVVSPVSSLDPEFDGMALFCERAFEADTTFDPSEEERATLRRLCARLDGIPLAIELAAARVRSFPPAELLERVDDRFRLLRRGSKATAERHGTLRATVAWSYQLLDPVEQRVFEQLSVFPGSFDLDAVEAVCAGRDELGADDDLDLIEIVTSLVDKSMVSSVRSGRRARYRLLETLRAYGEERLVERGLADEARARHQDHYVAVARKADQGFKGSAGSEASATFEVEWDNLRAAFMFASNENDLDAVIDIVDATTFWSKASLRSEQGEWVRQALALSGQLEQPSAILWGSAASDATTAGDYERAVTCATAGKSIASVSPERGGVLCWSQLCVALYQLGHADELRQELPGLDVMAAECREGSFEEGVARLVIKVSTALADPEHLEQRGDDFYKSAAKQHNEWLDDWVVVSRVRDRLTARDFDGALDAVPAAIEQTRAHGNKFLEGNLQGQRLVALASLGDERLVAAFADTLVELVAARNWQVLWWTLEALGEHWARAGKLSAAAVVIGHLNAHDFSSQFSLADRPATLKLIGEHESCQELMTRGAHMSRDELVEFALDRLVS
jgi:predicted ATPase/class 3 adenylate cyclase